MSPWQLTLQSLRYYWRTHVTVLAGLTLGAGVLIGALLVGDSVRFSLRRLALLRIGAAHHAVVGHDRFFRDELAGELRSSLGGLTAPVLMLEGSASLPTGARRANQVQVLGVDERFWELAGEGGDDPSLTADSVQLNEELARRLDIQPGASMVVRFARPSALPNDAPLSNDADQIRAVRVQVAGIVPDRRLGRFSLRAEQAPPPSVFFPLDRLQDLAEKPGRANLLLLGAEEVAAAEVETALRRRWTLTDSELTLEPVPSLPQWELRSPRVFLDAPVVAAARDAVPEAWPVLTYFANAVSRGDRSTPYSMIAAVPAGPDSPWIHVGGGGEDAIVITEWLADDLDAAAGDELTVKYYQMGPMRTLVETAAVFQVHSVAPLAGALADPALMPQFPGLAGVDNCRDWDPGFPLDLDRIRDRDEAYWDEHRGTPKAFLPLQAGRALWQNRFGNATAVRFPGDRVDPQALRAALTERISPAQLGVQVLPLREQALAAGAEAMDFSGLFVGFSCFLIAAALLLSGLLTAFGVEQRTREIGVLLAVGHTPYQVQRILLREGQLIALLAGLIGAVLAGGYTRLMLAGLRSGWRSAIGDAPLWYHATSSSVVVGMFTSVALGVLVIAWSTRRLTRQPVTRLLQAEVGAPPSAVGRPRWAWIVAVAPAAAAAALLFRTGQGSGATQASGFFGAGALLLVAALVGCRNLLAARLTRSSVEPLTLRALAGANVVRRRGRSLGAVALLACGVFMVIGTGAHKVDAARGEPSRKDGAGGFTLLADLTAPLARDLNRRDVQEYFGLDPDLFANVRFVPVRERPGDEASCLNLNRAQIPQLLAVPPDAMQGRFTFAAVHPSPADRPEVWSSLADRFDDGAVPGVSDYNSIRWALGKQLGDTLEYTDERGRPLRVRLVAGAANSILQGAVIIGQRPYLEAFPSDSGISQWWIECSPARADAVAEALSFGLKDYGLEIVPARRRLNQYNEVQNTYLLIFQVLGGMGLLLGSVGLGVVVLRNVLERRAELGVLRAIGFPPVAVRTLIIREHARLVVGGVGIGLVTALLSVAPSLRTPGQDLPLAYLGGILIGVILNALLWAALAAAWALRANLIASIRSE